MTVKREVVMCLNFFVHWLLLMGTNRLCGHGLSPGRTALGGLLGAIYAGACLLPETGFLGNLLWRVTALGLMALLAFGMYPGSIRRAVVFVLLSMALNGIVYFLGSGNVWSVAAGGGIVSLLCILGFRGKIGSAPYVPVELTYKGKSLKLTALQDTGNCLCDPVTGSPVLVVDKDTAVLLTGLSPDQLRKPVETMGTIPGLRLIPYRSVGTENGLMLGLRLQEVKIGSWKGSRVVAFAPGSLSMEGEYQALTGGAA